MLDSIQREIGNFYRCVELWWVEISNIVFNNLSIEELSNLNRDESVSVRY